MLTQHHRSANPVGTSISCIHVANTDLDPVLQVAKWLAQSIALDKLLILFWRKREQKNIEISKICITIDRSSDHVKWAWVWLIHLDLWLIRFAVR